jgi:hypothetical protein
MTYDQARLWLITRSLVMITSFGLIFILAPATPYPLGFDQALAILQMIFPLFLGYLSSAVVFVTTPPTRAGKEPLTDLVSVLVKWPFYVVVILCVAVLAAFGARNWPNAGRVTAMACHLIH